MQTCANFEAHGILPFPGAWVEQPQSWVDALYQWRAWLRYVQRQESADEPRKGKDIFDEFTGEGDSFGDWRGMIGE